MHILGCLQQQRPKPATYSKVWVTHNEEVRYPNIFFSNKRRKNRGPILPSLSFFHLAHRNVAQPNAAKSRSRNRCPSRRGLASPRRPCSASPGKSSRGRVLTAMDPPRREAASPRRPRRSPPSSDRRGPLRAPSRRAPSRASLAPPRSLEAPAAMDPLRWPRRSPPSSGRRGPRRAPTAAVTGSPRGPCKRRRGAWKRRLRPVAGPPLDE